MHKEVLIRLDDIKLHGHLIYPEDIKAWVIFAHGSGSSHLSPRNNWVADELCAAGFGTFLFDLLTTEEDEIYRNRFNISLLAERLHLATLWLMNRLEYHLEHIAYFGASTGAAAALLEASRSQDQFPLFAIISRGGRPDLVHEEFLHEVTVPTLLIVGGHDREVIEFNQFAQGHLSNSKLALVPGATHLFEEEGTMEEVIFLSKIWLEQHLPISEKVQEVRP